MIGVCDRQRQGPCFGDGRFKLLSPSDSPAVFDLYVRCHDYFILQDGEPASIADAEALFTDVPPGKRPEDQFVLGVYRGRRLCAVALLLTDYPEERDWYLGLLLLDPAIRRKGIGQEIYAAIERWSTAQGARRMLLAVLKDNEAALRFWRASGFDPVRSVGPATFKRKSHERIEMVRTLDQATMTAA